MSQKMYIPSVADAITLTADWEFTCYIERKNIKFLSKMRPELGELTYSYGVRNLQSALVVIPKGSVLRVARIYIRNGKKDFDSLTFTVAIPTAKKPFKPGRFWAKLADVNEIEFVKGELGE